MLTTERKFKTPRGGHGIPQSPWRPKYATDKGVTGFEVLSWNDDGSITAIFRGNPEVLELISREADVVELPMD